MTTPDPADVHTGTDRVELTLLAHQLFYDESDDANVCGCGERAPQEFIENYPDDWEAPNTPDAAWWASHVSDLLDTAALAERDNAMDQLGTSGHALVAARRRLATFEDEFPAVVRQRDAARAELAAANARCAELEEGKDGPYACCRCCPDDDPEYHAENPPNSHSTWCKSCGTPSAIAERDALQATLDRVTAALRDFRDFGIRADLNPTINAANPPDYGWWSGYLRRADESVRERARAALTPEGKDRADRVDAEDGGR